MMMQSEMNVLMSDKVLAALLGAPDWDQLCQQVLALLAGSGIDDFLLQMDVDIANGTTCSHLVGSVPAPILKLFNTKLNTESDPVNRHIARSSLPLAWEVAPLCELDCGRPYAAVKAHGIRHATSVTVRSALAVSRVDFYRHSEQCPPLSTALTAKLLLLGSYLHEAVHVLWNKQNTHPAPTLTEREHECLYWSAGGKTSKETAMILGISQHTVYFHLKNVANKFNVHSTRHAITRATWMGMIKPQLS
jgi:DNA-binding CsgD family transcriptional regulator